MDPDVVRGLINQLVYPLAGGGQLSDATAERLVDDMIEGTVFASSAAEFAEAVAATLSSGRLPGGTMQMVPRYSEAEMLQFVRRVADQLDRRRPWPRPRFAKLDPEQWIGFAGTVPIARVNLPTHEITGAVGELFDPVPAGGVTLPVMILQLRSGATVALAGTEDPLVFTVRVRGPGTPAAVIEEFRQLTGFTAEEVSQA